VQIAEQELIVGASLVHCCAAKKNVIVASQLYDVADVQFEVDSTKSRLSLRPSHRLELLFNLCGNKVKTMRNPTVSFLVKPDEAK